jgi:hypothetical protein
MIHGQEPGFLRPWLHLFKTAERNWLGSAGGIPPHPLSARLTLNRIGKDDFKFLGGKFYRQGFLKHPSPIYSRVAGLAR